MPALNQIDVCVRVCAVGACVSVCIAPTGPCSKPDEEGLWRYLGCRELANNYQAASVSRSLGT